jgi:hypothetical protein
VSLAKEPGSRCCVEVRSLQAEDVLSDDCRDYFPQRDHAIGDWVSRRNVQLIYWRLEVPLIQL